MLRNVFGSSAYRARPTWMVCRPIFTWPATKTQCDFSPGGSGMATLAARAVAKPPKL